ncbi:MAG: P-loop NTPase [Candidatus Methanomethyliaceae archaeon]|nr:P-loop NTPase [Candidatus Methanomethyliaceae archaeon]
MTRRRTYVTVTFTIHSYRGGTGKSTTTANLSILLVVLGKRVATIEMDITSLVLHLIYNGSAKLMRNTVNDYVYGRCKFGGMVLDLTGHLKLPRDALYFIGSSMTSRRSSRS